MSRIAKELELIKGSIPGSVTLVAVSKTKPLELLKEAYAAGQRHFGENRVQELEEKYNALPKDICWHMIGHLQSKKVKTIAPFVHLIHGVDSFKLLAEINKQALKNNRTIDCLLQFFIAQEETKFGFDLEEALEMLGSDEFAALKNIRLVGIMGMATFTDDTDQIRTEFKTLASYFDQLKSTHFENVASFKEISMGMSGDYAIAIEEGSTMVRIGSAIFGGR
ncbi:MAG: YggS family pyridoxal phosphate-dependent enzyme [Crocinitomix sp.]|nr:YggS family pyridoxal phosphate-dependent enzyme [Crocinitomix sp.]